MSCKKVLHEARNAEMRLAAKLKKIDETMFVIIKNVADLEELRREAVEEFKKISEALRCCGPKGADA